MKDNLKLGDRLQKCADYVPFGAKFLDIGTDHGYLPIWLLNNGKIQTAIAADINKDPLASASENAKKFNAQIKTVLSNGFEHIEQNDFDCAVIAGMGGELIANILENGKNVITDNDILILQPMSKSSKLREYLCENGFCIEKEEAVFHKGKIYSVMCVKKGESKDVCLYMGKIIEGSLHSVSYANSVLHDLTNNLKGQTGEEYDKTKDKIREIRWKYLIYDK